MPTEPQTFRDHTLSLFQSAVERLALDQADARTGLGMRPGLENPIVRAASQICALQAQGATTLPVEAPESIAAGAWTCARLGFELLRARVRGDLSEFDRLKDELKCGECDSGWAETLLEYTEYFGPDGTRRQPEYIRPGAAGSGIVEIDDGARIALIADWGTGTPAAIALLQQVRQQNPDLLIHLGDVYYSGTPEECHRYFRQIVDDVFDRGNTRMPVFNMAGNHDMYCGGVGFYQLIKDLNDPPYHQEYSFFCLRTKKRQWQVLAMDTGLHDYDPFSVTDAVTFLDADEAAWHVQRVAELAGGRTILLSHHQLFSAFSQIGPVQPDGSLQPCNPKLLRSFQRLSGAGRIAAWFWGHEHNLCIYEAYAGLDKGRCIGHGAIPVMRDQNPYSIPDKLLDPPALVEGTELGLAGPLYGHGFAMISLDPNGGPARAEYYQYDVTEPTYRELLA